MHTFYCQRPILTSVWIFPAWGASRPAVTFVVRGEFETSGLTLLSDTNAASFFYIHDWLFETLSSHRGEVRQLCARSMLAMCFAFFLTNTKWLMTNITVHNFFCAGCHSIHSLSFLYSFPLKRVSTAKITSWQRAVNQRVTKAVYKTPFSLMWGGNRVLEVLYWCRLLFDWFQKHFDICRQFPMQCTNKCDVRDFPREKVCFITLRQSRR